MRWKSVPSRWGDGMLKIVGHKKKPPARHVGGDGRVVFKNLAVSYFPTPRERSIIGAAELNCRVRNGDGWVLRAMAARRLVGTRFGSARWGVHGMVICGSTIGRQRCRNAGGAFLCAACLLVKVVCLFPGGWG